MSAWTGLGRPVSAAIVVAAFTLSDAVDTLAVDSEEPATAEEMGRDRTPEEREEAERETQLWEHTEKARRIERHLGALGPDQRELREKLEQQLHEIRQRLQHADVPNRIEMERERWTRRLEELKEAIIRARVTDRHEEAGRLEREAQEIMHLLRGGAKRLAERGEEEMQRLQHLKHAVENLRAGGFHDLAERLQRELEERRQELRREWAPDAPRRFEHVDRLPHFDLPEGPPRRELDGAVRDLQAEVRRLHHQIEEIREHVKHLAEERLEQNR